MTEATVLYYATIRGKYGDPAAVVAVDAEKPKTLEGKIVRAQPKERADG